MEGESFGRYRTNYYAYFSRALPVWYGTYRVPYLPNSARLYWYGTVPNLAQLYGMVGTGAKLLTWYLQAFFITI